MEVHPGIFVSGPANQEWEPTPDYAGTEFHALVETDELHAGLFRIAQEGSITFPWSPPARETVIVLEGEVRIEIDGGPTVVLQPGSMASFAAGTRMTWHVKAPFRDAYVIG